MINYNDFIKILFPYNYVGNIDGQDDTDIVPGQTDHTVGNDYIVTYTQEDELHELGAYDITAINLPGGLSGASTITTDDGAMVIRDVTIGTDARNTRYAASDNKKWEPVTLLSKAS